MVFKAYGKINLSLDITGILPNGYHSVSMLMQSVDLYDNISIEKSSGITVRCDDSRVPDGEGNLAYKACELMINEFSIPHGFDIYINKNIPIAGGMAGGSTDAATVLRGINEMCNIGASTEKLMEMALSLGADVPFCVQVSPALAEGIGEVLTPIKGLSKDVYILLVNPNIFISTKDIYTQIDNDKIFNKVNNRELIAAVAEMDFQKMKKNMVNVMQTVTEAICPQIKTIIRTLDDNGACVSLMSGSGATCYGIFDSKHKALNAQKLFADYFTAITHPVE